MPAYRREHLRPGWMLKVPRVPLTEETKAYFLRLSSEDSPIPRGRWYRLDVGGESPIVSGLVRLSVRDDWSGSCSPLSVKLSLTFWGPVGLQHSELDAELREVRSKVAKRLLKGRMHDESA